MPEQGQLRLVISEPAPRAGRPPITRAEKVAVRAAQGGLCQTCGAANRNGHALDVVRGLGGIPVAFCRRDRLRFDAAERCRKGASRRRRSTNHPRRRSSGQRHLEGM